MSSGTAVVTLTDARYFLGTVALVNSLRLTGHADEVVVVDGGLSVGQSRLLAQECAIVAFPTPGSLPPAFLKPAALDLVRSTGRSGPTLFIDSDIIITGDLDPVLAQVEAGHICLLPDGPPRLQGRRFEEWVPLLGLDGPLRRQPYVNSGFVGLHTGLWGALITRWRSLCARASDRGARAPQWMSAEVAGADPFAYLDQDVLNALLMTEVAADRVHILEWWRQGLPEPDDTTRLTDPRTLRCRNDEGSTLLLHHLTHPKPWLPEARTRLHYAPYDELMARLLDADDVPLRLGRDDVPPWMRNGRAHRIARRARRSHFLPMRVLRRVQELH